MATDLGPNALASPHRAGYLPSPWKPGVQYLAYKWGGYSTWLPGQVVGDESFFDPQRREFMWRIAASTGARLTRADRDVVAIPRAVFDHMARVERDVYTPAYKYKLEALGERRRTVCGYPVWAAPPPTEEMRQVAHAFANVRVRQAEGLSSHGPRACGRGGGAARARAELGSARRLRREFLG